MFCKAHIVKATLEHSTVITSWGCPLGLRQSYSSSLGAYSRHRLDTSSKAGMDEIPGMPGELHDWSSKWPFPFSEARAVVMSPGEDVLMGTLP